MVIKDKLLKSNNYFGDMKLDLNKLEKNMVLLTYSYIVLPLLLFAVGWLKIYCAIPFTIIIIISIYFAILNTRKTLEEKANPLLVSIPTILTILFIIIIWTAISGIGGIGYQNGDYDKHNAILRDLINAKWPVMYNYSSNGSDKLGLLVYYSAYYLPASLVGKLLGWNAANVAIFLWSVIGLLISCYWFLKIIKKVSIFLMIMYVIWGGMDIIGYFAVTNSLPKIGDYFQQWMSINKDFNYQIIMNNNSNLLYWVPHQAIAGWIITGLIMYEFINRNNCKNCIILWAISIFWSPFVFIGLTPFILLCIIKNGIKQVINFQSIIGGSTIILLIGFYFISNRMNSGVSGWIFKFNDYHKILIQLVLFVMVEFGLYGILIIGIFIKTKNKLTIWLIVSMFFLTLSCFYRIGFYNDFTMRASIPALFIILICIASFLTENGNIHLKVIIGVMIIIASLTTISDSIRAINNFGYKSDSWYSLININKYTDQYVDRELLNNKFYNIFIRKNEALNYNSKLSQIYRNNDFDWNTWQGNDLNKVIFDTQNRTISCEERVDAGIVAPITLDRGRYVVKIAVSGYTKNIKDDFVTVTLYGDRSILSIPAGFNFETPEVFSAIFSIDKDQYNGKITFGLGGWSQAAGRIKLNEISISKVND